jgi:hypothetical protein
VKLPVATVLSTVIAASGGCAITHPSNNFSGKAHDVAQAVANFQSAVSSRDQAKICGLLSAQLVAELRKAQPTGGCQAAFKLQLKDVDSTVLTVKKQCDIKIIGNQAGVRVEDTQSGKTYDGNVLLLALEHGFWKIDLQPAQIPAGLTPPANC